MIRTDCIIRLIEFHDYIRKQPLSAVLFPSLDAVQSMRMQKNYDLNQQLERRNRVSGTHFLLAPHFDACKLLNPESRIYLRDEQELLQLYIT